MDMYYALFSGGVDSTLATLIVLSRSKPVKVTPVFFDYGQVNSTHELAAVQELIPLMRSHIGHVSSELYNCKAFTISGLFAWSHSPILKWGTGDRDKPDLENRNMILIGCVASMIMAQWKPRRPSGSRAFIIAGFKNEHYDTKTRFSDRNNSVFQAMDKPIKIITPLIPEANQTGRISAHQLARIAHKLDVLPVLERTWSCYYPQDKRSCGSCPACEGRNAFFSELKTRTRIKQRP